MPDAFSAMPSGVKRVIYKEILDGDRRKFEARSNDARSGGGARDLRFSFEAFEPAFKAIFPEVAQEIRKREGERDELGILRGEFHWMEEGGVRHAPASFEPPTDARPAEGRIPQINSYGCFRDIPEKGGGRLFLLLVQREDDTVWPGFATEDSLRSGKWDPRVASEILRCVGAVRNAGVAVAGYMDYTTGRTYCNERTN
jgi:hypothetical protein